MAPGLHLITVLVLITRAHAMETRAKERQLTNEIQIKQGLLKGEIVEPSRSISLSKVNRYLGIPYAAAPIGSQRFMPPGAPPHWYGVKICDKLPPVCPQKLPEVNKVEMSSARFKYMERLRPFLEKQSEDCLYLNIYAPNSDYDGAPKKYPVIVFIHGESFEWNSGNPYDGSVLAAYGKVVVITLNFRLGVLGFMKPGIADNIPSNFGLFDQIAALQWIQDNIRHFNGDPAMVTLMGHGTGAACVNFLMISPVSRGAQRGLFHRGILMSGTALADWALVTNPIPFTTQVADGLNCSPPQEQYGEMTKCLRSKRLEEIIHMHITGPRFMTKFGPLVDGAVVPNEPNKVMNAYKESFGSYDLMYGLTEIESYNLLNSVSLAAGMLEKDFESMLRAYLTARFENFPDIAYMKTLSEYTDIRNDGSRVSAAEHRDTILDILSDARVAAPLIEMAKLHSSVNPKSYFYIFGHNGKYGDHAMMDKSVTGEEIPFVFGVPLGGPKYHYVDAATDDEIALSEQVMTYWSNFAKTGNPNAPRRLYYSPFNSKARKFDVDWPEYDHANQSYVNIGIPPATGHHYRNDLIQFWNQRLPRELENTVREKIKAARERQPPPWIQYPPPKVTHFPNLGNHVFGNVRDHPKPTNYVREKEGAQGSFQSLQSAHNKIHRGHKANDGIVEPVESFTEPNEPIQTASTTLSLVIALGILFFLLNVFAFALIFYKKKQIRAKQQAMQSQSYTTNLLDGSVNQSLDDGQQKPLGFFGLDKPMFKQDKSMKSEGTYEAVKSEGQSKREDSRMRPTSPRLYQKIPGFSRQFSTTTIDPHTKVRDWISNEIIQKYSPKIIRKSLARRDSGSVKYKRYNPEQTSSRTSTLERGTEKTTMTRTDEDSDRYLAIDPKRAPDFILTTSNIPTKTHIQPSSLKPKIAKKPRIDKVSIAIDATPSGRGSSVLRQIPIELTKSIDMTDIRPPENVLRRSATMEDFLDMGRMKRADFRRSCSIDLKPERIGPAYVVKINHGHSRSDPVPMEVTSRKFGTFSRNGEVNVTSRESKIHEGLSPEQTLNTMKKRNFPKVLPDMPKKFATFGRSESLEEPNKDSCGRSDGGTSLEPSKTPEKVERGALSKIIAQKRRSLPPQSQIFTSFRPKDGENLDVHFGRSDGPDGKYTQIQGLQVFEGFTGPPAPPPRTTSTLDRKFGKDPPNVITTIHFKPSIPSKPAHIGRDVAPGGSGSGPAHVHVNYDASGVDGRGVSTVHCQQAQNKGYPTTIVQAGGLKPLRVEPKVVIRPGDGKVSLEKTKKIPRVNANDPKVASKRERVNDGFGLGKCEDTSGDDDIEGVFLQIESFDDSLAREIEKINQSGDEEEKEVLKGRIGEKKNEKVQINTEKKTCKDNPSKKTKIPKTPDLGTKTKIPRPLTPRDVTKKSHVLHACPTVKSEAPALVASSSSSVSTVGPSGLEKSKPNGSSGSSGSISGSLGSSTENSDTGTVKQVVF